MTRSEIVRRAYEVFRADVRAVPPLTLRGGNAVDSYDEAVPFDPAHDEPTDAYLEGFAFWGLAYLDARSWRHYLPRLIDYAVRRPDDPSMVVEALLRSLRPPDRYPPRLATLTDEQESLIVAFLESVAFEAGFETLESDARQALEEWWLPGAHRPGAECASRAHAAAAVFHAVARALFRLDVPATFTSSGVREIPEESRTVEVWHGVVGSEVPATIAVNITPRTADHLRVVADRAARGLRAASVQACDFDVPGAGGSYRLDGLTRGDSPVEPQRIAIVAARSRDSVVTLSVRWWPRADVDAAMERVVRSLAIPSPSEGG